MSPWVFLLPLIAMGFDIITGYTAAWTQNKINSSEMRDGIYKKIGECFAIVASLLIEFGLKFFTALSLDLPITQQITYNPQLVAIVCMFIFLMEILSITENIGCMNEKVGKLLIKYVGIDPAKVNLEEANEDADNPGGHDEHSK